MIELVLELRDVAVRRGGAALLGPLDWTVRAGERWAVVGPNGSGKTTLLRVASSMLLPSQGRVAVLGSEIGTVDARELRRRIGFASAALAAAIGDERTPLEVVVTARHAALAPWWHRYEAADWERGRALLDRFGVGALAEREFGSLSTGERQRVQLARALMPDPELLLLDEPAAGLDLGAREDLVGRLEALAVEDRPLAIVLVTHHVEEIPAGFDRALVLRDGRAVASGLARTAITDRTLSEAFGLPLRVRRDAGRWSARRT